MPLVSAGSTSKLFLLGSALFLGGFFALLLSPLPPLGPAQLIRADVAYTLSVVSAVCLFVQSRRYVQTAVGFGLALLALSFIYPHFVAAFFSRLLYLFWGWLGLLWATWRLWRLWGVLLAFAIQYAVAFVYLPLEFANLLPDWALRTIGDDPRLTFLNWARYLLTYATALATLYTVGMLGKARINQRAF
ncbi:hypothetical protein [Pyrobaculum sp.]|uniref:hypothetical protein n=1 Tax=Pyrobaculum sp. TaxID=2004705 RepID=UPI0031741699